MSSGVPSSPVIAKFLSCLARFISVPPSTSSKPRLRSQVPPLYLSVSCGKFPKQLVGIGERFVQFQFFGEKQPRLQASVAFGSKTKVYINRPHCNRYHFIAHQMAG
ncbi:hypothetical protein NC651_024147 [Populus alba x Populus x berolinensis]|nr:hypothetical protein NC651_024147 [Populus alba x Populus x berolinensis]